MTIEDLVTPFLGNIVNFARKVTDAEITIIKNAIIDHKEKTIEYDIQIILPNEGSKREKIGEKIQSYLKDQLIIEKVLSYTAVIVPNSYNLTEKGIATIKDARFELDIGKLIREGNFDVASFKIVQRVADEVLSALVVPTKSRSGVGDGTRIRVRLEISIDYASAWYKKYDRFAIKDIEYYENIVVAPATIAEVLPQDFYRKLMSAARAYQTGNKAALQFFTTLNNNFLLFESDQFYSKILACVNTDSDAFQVVEVIPKMQNLDLMTGGPKLLLPGSFRIRFRTSIEGKDIVNKANAFIDVSKLKAVFSELIALTKLQTKHLQF